MPAGRCHQLQFKLARAGRKLHLHPTTGRGFTQGLARVPLAINPNIHRHRRHPLKAYLVEPQVQTIAPPLALVDLDHDRLRPAQGKLRGRRLLAEQSLALAQIGQRRRPTTGIELANTGAVDDQLLALPVVVGIDQRQALLNAGVIRMLRRQGVASGHQPGIPGKVVGLEHLVQGSGAGLVTLATRPEHVTAALARCPSVMVHGLIHGSELPPLLEAASVVVCGPGMGQGAWAQQMLEQVVESSKPRVLDADALNLLSTRVALPAENQVLTPHPGEAARLLGCLVPEVEADRMAAARTLQSVYGGTVLLKGAGTVIASDRETVDIVSGSNPGMATGGMGDVLAGIIGALYGQLDNARRAAALAASVHLAAANLASEEKGFMGLIPTDVIDALPKVLRQSEALSSQGREEP
ncbi:carbohydrate kinase [Marinobacter similis]|uniref:ADP-dependent (S)-NAD(P)H-hydrate dehydratase n=1 Tax=Marinobacter similis TaxID=1420916 RepID=W5YLI1_9GAMM|nr:carbohydrate kinase [Marinobacter similis]